MAEEVCSKGKSAYFEHPVEGAFCWDADMLRYVNNIGSLLEGSQHALQRCLFHIRANHILSERIEGLLRILFTEPVHEADFSSNNELFF